MPDFYDRLKNSDDERFFEQEVNGEYLSVNSNSTEPLNGGWPAYEFGDNQFSGVMRDSKGQSSFSTSSRTTVDSRNLFTVQFQDEFNEYHRIA